MVAIGGVAGKPWRHSTSILRLGARRLAIDEIEEVARFVFAVASVIFQDQEFHATEATGEIRVIPGAGFLPETRGFELRRPGHR